ncbi:hypothetical protein O181_032170 [Austropuccinia psidii MF-1]|uniref:Uncharacterized protein n=1 Tax=Austropuccinia psidii MF-1 TaxID=1389203 RepID=A0A9Q3D0J0_9BASI|nr:hypothetical protein [Austropuccinia psidii MF-1]
MLEDTNTSGQLAWFHLVLICPPLPPGHRPMVTSLLDRSKVIIRPMKDGNGKSKPLQARVAPNGWRTYSAPSQHNEPPTPGSSQASDSQLPSHEKNLTCEPETEVAPTQSSEEPFACPTTPCSFIIIDNMPVGTPPPPLPLRSQLPLPPSAKLPSLQQ